MAIKVDIAVFAHNEASNIAKVISEIAIQDISSTSGYDVRVLILSNGSTDNTVGAAQDAIAGLPSRFEVFDLPQSGKSRTWNTFVHSLSRNDAAVLVFCDADIELPDDDALRQLVEGLLANPLLSVFNSQPVKDIVHRPDGLSAQDKLIAAASGTLDDWKKAICGQLYAMRPERARKFSLPIGLPVEDGFLRAMVLTDALTEDEDMRLIDGGDVWHVYESERTVSNLIRHQTRIVIGSAINAACFAYLRELPATMRHAELELAAQSEDWLKKVIASQLPRWPWGYVPGLYLYKRVRRISSSPKDLLKPKRLVLLFAGLGFDLIVFVAAQIRMVRGVGAGHW